MNGRSGTCAARSSPLIKQVTNASRARALLFNIPSDPPHNRRDLVQCTMSGSTARKRTSCAQRDKDFHEHRTPQGDTSTGGGASRKEAGRAEQHRQVNLLFQARCAKRRVCVMRSAKSPNRLHRYLGAMREATLPTIQDARTGANLWRDARSHPSYHPECTKRNKSLA